MRLELVCRGAGDDGRVRERVERRLGFALGRFGDRVGRVAVHLSDENGPRGGVDKRCRVVAEVPDGGPDPVVIELDGADLNGVIDRAADRISQAVGRRLDRARLFARPIGPAGLPRRI